MLAGNWIMMSIGVLAIIGGYFMIANAEFRGWALKGRRARIWLRLLGEQRAHTVTKFVFGPFTFLFGILLVAAAALGGPVGA